MLLLNKSVPIMLKMVFIPKPRISTIVIVSINISCIHFLTCTHYQNSKKIKEKVRKENLEFLIMNSLKNRHNHTSNVVTKYI